MRLALLAVLVSGCFSGAASTSDGGVAACERCVVYERFRCASVTLVEECVPGACEGTTLGHWEPLRECAAGASCFEGECVLASHY